MTSWLAKEMQLSNMAKTSRAKGIASAVNSIAVLPLRSRRKPAILRFALDDRFSSAMSVACPFDNDGTVDETD
jgi:hypothetical protein